VVAAAVVVVVIVVVVAIRTTLHRQAVHKRRHVMCATRHEGGKTNSTGNSNSNSNGVMIS